MYEFLRGPLVWIAFAALLIGAVYKIWRLYKLADKEVQVLPYMSTKPALRSLMHWLIPFASRNMRQRPVMTVVAFAFHFCLIATPLLLMAHNAPFDLGFLRAGIHLAGLQEIPNPVIDTQLLAMKAYPKRKSYALQNLATELGLPRNRAHRACDDAELCMRLFLSCVDALSFMGDLPLSEVLTGPSSR